ncbi:hypothetical protein ACFYU9_22245 [Streptomyces sp. NPDC004327]|uniref:hypothetical protein n=1 Tax=Streptomyces sp. NPDC004327 TaxID=3364699 RepID=UPI0036847702
MIPSVRRPIVLAALALALTGLASEPVIGWDSHPADTAVVAAGPDGVIGWDAPPADVIGRDAKSAGVIGWD